MENSIPENCQFESLKSGAKSFEMLVSDGTFQKWELQLHLLSELCQLEETQELLSTMVPALVKHDNSTMNMIVIMGF